MSNLKKMMGGLGHKFVACTVASPVAMIVEVLMETAIPIFMAKIVDIGIAGRDLPYVIKTGGIMLGLALVSLSAGMAGARFSAVAAHGFSFNLRQKLFAKVQEFSFANIDKFSTASLVTRLTTDVTNVQNVYQMMIRMSARAPFMLVSATVMACVLNKNLAAVFIVSVPVLSAVIIAVTFVAYPRFMAMLKKYDSLNSTVQENLIAIRVVKAFVREKFESLKFEKAAADIMRTQVAAEKLVVLVMPFMQLVVYSTIIAVLWFGGKMVVSGSMMTGELISFITYITQILMSLMMLGMIFVSIVISRASVTRILEILDEDVDIISPLKNKVTEVKDGSIYFENVSFAYGKNSESLALEKVNLHIESGQVVGVIGGTGSSKTTLVSLVPRLYDVREGSVKVGGVDVRNYDLTALRDAVAMVLQKNVLFSGTIAENLRWGDETATEAELEAACEAADASSFVKGFASGYETELGQGGVNVSGGQKQRLCIARALLKKPKVLILDDSTSAVDTATEARIRESLKKQHPEVTKIIIAQRISSIKDSDFIIVMDNGQISGVGTHEELLATNEIYREVFESQQNEGDADLEGGQ